MEEHGLRLLGNVLLSKIFRPKREDITGMYKKWYSGAGNQKKVQNCFEKISIHLFILHNGRVP